MKLGAKAKFSIYYALLALPAFMAFQELVLGPMLNPEEEVPYSQFRADLAEGRIAEAGVWAPGPCVLFPLPAGLAPPGAGGAGLRHTSREASIAMGTIVFPW